MRTCVRVTSQGSAHGRFRHALNRGQVNFALEAAAELPAVALDEALELCELLATARMNASQQRRVGGWLGSQTRSIRPSMNS